MPKELELTILMPCLNEALTLATCINKAHSWAGKRKINYEVLIADNGSDDGSQSIALQHNARVVNVPTRGYGAALHFGALNAKGKYIIMGDSDDSYNFSDLDAFIFELRAGHDLVMGNRFAGGIAKGAMPWKNRYIGNPILTKVGKLLFNSSSNDFHCGLRGVRRDSLIDLDLRTTGMEYASEMVIKATLHGLKMKEVPTTLSPDGRNRAPHLRPWRDGWRHLRFMMMFSPNWLFIYPGLIIAFFSLLIYTLIFTGPLRIGKVTLSFNTLFYMQAIEQLGLTMIFTGVIVKMIGYRDGLFPEKKYINKLRDAPLLEYGIFASALFVISGVVLAIRHYSLWSNSGFGNLDTISHLKLLSLSTNLIATGGILLVFSLISGFLALPMRNEANNV